MFLGELIMELYLLLAAVGAFIVFVAFKSAQKRSSSSGQAGPVNDDFGAVSTLKKKEQEFVRAKNSRGRFVADDPSTPDVNEAWVGGKAPPKKRKKKSDSKKSGAKKTTKKKSSGRKSSNRKPKQTS